MTEIVIKDVNGDVIIYPYKKYGGIWLIQGGVFDDKDSICIERKNIPALISALQQLTENTKTK